MQKLTASLVLLAIATFLVAQGTRKSYHGHIVFRIMLETDEQLSALEKLEAEGLVDVWNERAVRGAPHDVRVAPTNQHIFATTMFEKHNTQYEIKIPNVQTLIDRELSRQAKIPDFSIERFLSSNSVANDEFFHKYHKWSEVVDFMNALHQKYPTLTSIFSIGKTLNGRDILGIKITGPNNGTKPAMVYNGGQHAREWISPITNLYLANRKWCK